MWLFEMGIYSERLISIDGVIVSRITYVIVIILIVTNISSLFNFLILYNARNVIVSKIKTLINRLINSRGFIIIKYINIFM